MNISKHITLIEATKSQTAIRKGIDNTPDEATIERMKLVAEKIFEPIRERFGVPIGVSSFYRSPKLNKAIGGAKNSQHVTGEAIDIDADIFGGVTNQEIFNFVKYHLNFDQLIREYGDKGWVHVSYRSEGNRGQVLEIG